MLAFAPLANAQSAVGDAPENAIPDSETRDPPTPARLAEIERVAGESGWFSLAPAVRSAALRAYAQDRYAAADAWYHVYEWLGLFAEPESSALRAFVADADLVSCELAVTEVPRAIRRATADAPALRVGPALERGRQLLDSIALLPVDRPLLAVAGAIDEPMLRTLDAIHVAAAAAVSPVDGFVSYDRRQSAVARLAGLRTVAPGG